MDYANNGSNSYGSGDAMSSSLANMSIGDQHQNGVGDVKMKGQRAWGECACVGESKLPCVRWRAAPAG